MLHRFQMHQEQNKSILVIKSEFLNLSSAVTFMTKRDWTFYTTHKLHEAILYISRHQPQFVMVSIDHPNKNIRSFIRMLMQTFPNRVIVFAENPHVLTYHYFNEIGSAYNIYPPVSGPAIERTLLAYYKGQMAQGTPNIRLFKGPQWNKILENEYWIYRPKKQPPRFEMLSDAKAKQLLTLVDDESLAGLAENRLKKNDEQGSVNTVAETPSEKGSVQAVTEEAMPGGSVQAVGEELSPRGSVQAINEEDSKAGSVDAIELEHPAGKAMEATRELPPAGKIDERASAEEERTLRGYQHESLISRAAHEALEKTVHKTRAAYIEKVEMTSDMSCIVVESTRFEGYLVAAIGRNREPEEAFIRGLQERIFHFLRDNGEQINESDMPMLVTLKRVDFKSWAASEAEFMRKSEHNQEEVSIAFFPRPQIRLQFEDSENEKMAKIKMEELKADVPVEFNLYIYLEENKRYVRYTPKGAKLLSSQKERLERQGLKHMHVYKEELPEFNRYRAQNYLNDKIDHFHARSAAA
ncbi:hypothetical protein [Bdellovibrio sp. HCB2-146]|uniref:hypothetical protein n=1 Tax=Bdellovibrio sp. HCB2-146 TaxID=3394362 RepID=UPI0039BC3D44